MAKKGAATEAVRVAGESISFGLIKRVEDSCSASSEQMLERLLDLRNSIDETYFEMGGLFRKILDNKIYLEFGFTDWRSFVEEKLGYGIRKTQYLMQIYHYFAVEVADEETIRKISPLGWSKCKELVGVVDPKNVDDWVKQCINLTVTEVSQKAAEFFAEKKGLPAEAAEKSARMVSFKLYEAQADNVEDAIKLAGEVSGSDVRSNNLSLVALDYLSHNAGLVATDPVIKAGMVKNSLKALELSLGMKLIAIEKSTDQVVFGQEYVTA